MNIFEYVKGIKKRFTKVDIGATIDTVNAELVNITIPLLADKAAWLVKDDSQVTSNFYQRDRESIMTDFSKSGYLRKSNPFDMILKSLRNTVEILAFLKAYFDKSAGEELSSASVTVTESNALQLIDLAAFVSTYTRSWLDVILSAETNHRNNVNGELNITQAMFVYLGDNRANFGAAISILATPVEKIETMFKAIPEIVIAEVNPKAVTGTLGQDKIDPLRLNLIQSKWDPIYFIGMIISDYSAARYKAAKEEAAFLELRIARFKKQLEQKDDPHLANIIERRQGQLDAWRGKIKKMEDSVR